MSARAEPLFRRVDWAHCDACRRRPQAVTLIEFESRSYWGDDESSIARRVFICTDCASRAVRVGLDHEVPT